MKNIIMILIGIVIATVGIAHIRPMPMCEFNRVYTKKVISVYSIRTGKELFAIYTKH